MFSHRLSSPALRLDGSEGETSAPGTVYPAQDTRFTTGPTKTPLPTLAALTTRPREPRAFFPILNYSTGPRRPSPYNILTEFSVFDC